jgi:hypothetical protein
VISAATNTVSGTISGGTATLDAAPLGIAFRQGLAAGWA